MSKITLLLKSLEDESTILKEVVAYCKATTQFNHTPTYSAFQKYYPLQHLPIPRFALISAGRH